MTPRITQHRSHAVAGRTVARSVPSSLSRSLAAALLAGLAACGGNGGVDPSVTAADADPEATVLEIDEAAARRRKPQADTTTTTSTTTAPVTTTTQGTTTTTTTPTTTTVRSTVNSIDTIVNDMKLMNDTALAGIPSSYGFATGPGQIVMGSDPRGTATPSWWTPSNSTWKSGAYWNTLLPWLVVFDGVGNAASNTRVEMRNLKAYYKRRSNGQWVQITEGAVDGWNYPKTLQGENVSSPDLRTESGGTKSIRPAGGNAVFHGWCCGKASIDAPDVDVVYVTMQARLIVSDPSRPDDRASARYLIHVGGDYYPQASTSINDFAPTGYNPGIGMSRAKLVRNEWQSFSFTTIDVGAVERTGRATSEQALRAAPPPME